MIDGQAIWWWWSYYILVQHREKFKTAVIKSFWTLGTEPIGSGSSSLASLVISLIIPCTSLAQSDSDSMMPVIDFAIIPHPGSASVSRDFFFFPSGYTQLVWLPSSVSPSLFSIHWPAISTTATLSISCLCAYALFLFKPISSTDITFVSEQFQNALFSFWLSESEYIKKISAQIKRMTVKSSYTHIYAE